MNRGELTVFSADNLGVTGYFLSSFPKGLKLPSAFVSRLGLCRQRTCQWESKPVDSDPTLRLWPWNLGGPAVCFEFPDPGNKRSRALTLTDEKGLQGAWRGCHMVPSRETGSGQPPAGTRLP